MKLDIDHQKNIQPEKKRFATVEMLLAIAESPGFTVATQSSAEVYIPGRSGHWQIIVNGDCSSTDQYKSPSLIQTVLSDLDTYVAPIIDIASVLCLNPEFIAITGLSSAVATGVEVAATAINLTQAGQDFAAGADLQGVLGVIEAVGGAFQEIGKAEGVPIGACSTTNGLQQFGEALSEGGAVAQGIDGVVAGAQSGNILAAITSGLGGVAGVAGLASASTLQQYAAVGAELGSTALAAQRGDILAALDGLVQAAQTSGVLSAVFQNVEALYDGYFDQEISSLGIDPSKLTADPSTGVVTSPYSVVQVQNGGVVLALMNPNDPTYMADMAVAEAQAKGNPGMVIIVAHGNPLQVEESALYAASPQNVAATIEQLPVWKNGQLAKVVFDSCYTGAAPNSGSATPFNILPSWTSTVRDLSMADLTQIYLSNAASIAAANDPSFNKNIDVKAPDNFLWPSQVPSGTGNIPSDYINIPNSNTSYFIGPAANNNNPLNPTPNVPLLPDPNSADAGQWNYFGTKSGW